MIYAINYANDIFSMSAKFNLLTAKYIGKADKVFSYEPKDIDGKFYKENESILSLPRGNGYWLWKPYFIKKSLEKINFGDYLMYSDSGSVYIRKILNIINRMDQDVYLGNVESLEREYTKKDAFVLLDADIEVIKNTKQFEASFILIRKTKWSIKFIDEWLQGCLTGDLITDAKSCLGEDDADFIEHRHDQSLLSIVAKKNNIHPHIGLANSDKYKSPSKLLNAILNNDTAYIHMLKDKYLNSVEKTVCPRIFIHTRQKNTFIVLFALKEIKFMMKTFYREEVANKFFYFILKNMVN